MLQQILGENQKAKYVPMHSFKRMPSIEKRLHKLPLPVPKVRLSLQGEKARAEDMLHRLDEAVWTGDTPH